MYDNGEQQPIQFFTNEEMPATVGLVIDSSGSMREHRDEVTAAASAFAASATRSTNSSRSTSTKPSGPGCRQVSPSPSNLDQLRRALARAPAIGMTAVFDAVDRALDHLQLGTRDRKVLILVSDGGDNASSQTLAAVVEHARRTNAVIYSVALRGADTTRCETRRAEETRTRNGR